MEKIKTLRKEVFYPYPREKVWAALTTPQALAEWLMPNDFEPVVGKRFQFRVDGMMNYSGITDCEILEVEPPERLVFTWVSKMKNRPDHYLKSSNHIYQVNQTGIVDEEKAEYNQCAKQVRREHDFASVESIHNNSGNRSCDRPRKHFCYKYCPKRKFRP